jgi:hypothetical protein
MTLDYACKADLTYSASGVVVLTRVVSLGVNVDVGHVCCVVWDGSCSEVFVCVVGNRAEFG